MTRFISEFLTQTAHFENNFLDELVHLECHVVQQQNDGPLYEADLQTYGSHLFLEFAKIFKTLYVDRAGSEGESENQRKDIALCLQIVLASCQSAKTQAVEQNFLKKVVDICADNASALYLGEIQKYAQKAGQKQVGQAMFNKQFGRQYKHVNPELDLQECEREVIRMLQLARNLFYDSSSLLISFVEQGPDASSLRKKTTMQPAVRSASQSEKLVALFAQILEELGQQREFEPIVSEALMTMITFASQNQKCKNCFVSATSVSTQSKKVTLLKLVCDRILGMGHLQSNSRLLRLQFTLLRTLSLCPEVAKDIVKNKFIEDVVDRITPQCKNDKDIKLSKYYLSHFVAFLSAFTSTPEGQRQVQKIKQAFDLSLFLLETVSIPAIADEAPAELSPIQQMVCSILLYFRNATKDNRVNKGHFLKKEEFLPCLLSFLSATNQHPKIKAYTAAVLWSLVHGHQGAIGMLNKPAIISELQISKSEYQRQVDKDSLVKYADPTGEVRKDVNLEYHANYQLGASAKQEEHWSTLQRDMNAFMLKALTAILCLTQPSGF